MDASAHETPPPREPTREGLLRYLEHRVDAIRVAGRVTRVGIDGPDGAGKTFLADALAGSLRARGVPVIRASIDGFHRPREQRYARGRNSPEGFYRDSFDYPRMRDLLLDPLGPGGSGLIRRAIWNVTTDEPVDAAIEQADPNGVLIFEGVFLHNAELADAWDYSVFLRAEFESTFARMAVRDGFPADPNDPANARYLDGQRLYFEECHPEDRAHTVIDNSDYERPVIIKP
jgi:uridine kinase